MLSASLMDSQIDTVSPPRFRLTVSLASSARLSPSRATGFGPSLVSRSPRSSSGAMTKSAGRGRPLAPTRRIPRAGSCRLALMQSLIADSAPRLTAALRRATGRFGIRTRTSTVVVSGPHRLMSRTKAASTTTMTKTTTSTTRARPCSTSKSLSVSPLRRSRQR